MPSDQTHHRYHQDPRRGLEGFALLTLPGEGDYRAADGLDCRNYGGPLTGLPEARTLFAPMLGAKPEQVLVDGNASLAIMHDVLSWALLHGVPG